jgi:hypothetical protein
MPDFPKVVIRPCVRAKYIRLGVPDAKGVPGDLSIPGSEGRVNFETWLDASIFKVSY